MRLTRYDGRWLPTGASDHYRDTPRFPAIGSVVAYDYRAWEVTHVRIDDFTDEDAEKVKMYRPEYRDEMRGYHVSLRRLYGPKHHRENSRQDIALGVHALTRWRFEVYDEGRVPLCSCCGHPWPCIVSVAKAQSKEEAKRLETKLGRVGPGICYACGEVITARQKAASYGEGNVDLPGYPTPRFHLRESCRYERVSYLDRLTKADPDALAPAEENGRIW